MSIHIRPISSTELRALAHELADVMREVVDGGASLGFLTPLTPDELPAYWLSLIPEVQDGTRLVLVAFDGDRVVGSGQLKLASFPNAKHRAEVHKLFVANSVRRQGVGRSIMLALHDAALECGRSLILLQTRRLGPALSFYKRLGYQEVGVIPRYALTSSGERVDNMALYQELSA